MRRGTLERALIGLLIATIATFGLVTMVSAHARVTYVRWDDETRPARVLATTQEHVANIPGTYWLRVYDPSNRQVDRGDTTIDPDDSTRMSVSVNEDLASGTYRVDWQTVSLEDGHESSGSLDLYLAGQSSTPTTSPQSTPAAPPPAVPTASPAEASAANGQERPTAVASTSALPTSGGPPGGGDHFPPGPQVMLALLLVASGAGAVLVSGHIGNRA